MSSSSSSSSSSTGTVCKRTTFTYDKAHNRVQRSVTENSATVQTDYSYNQLNQLTQWQEGTGTPVSYQYDNNGNRSRRTQGSSQTDYAYDFDNRLREVDADGVIYRYQYDYRTRRVEREENGTTTRVSYSGGNSVLEFDSSNKIEAEFIRGSGMGGGIGSILYSVRPNGSGGEIVSLTNYNHRGDVVSKTDDTGAVTFHAAYEAFGKHPDETGSTQDRQRANTKEEDPTGLLNEGMRYRDLETGEFITRDPAGFIDGPNLYTYVRQNPWTKFDPLGLEEEKESAKPKTFRRFLSRVFGGRRNGSDTNSQESGETTPEVSSRRTREVQGNTAENQPTGTAPEEKTGGRTNASAGDSEETSLLETVVRLPLHAVAEINVLGNAADAMRSDQVDLSRQDPRNSSGVSVGFRGDGFKLGGGRFNPDKPDAKPSPLGGHQGLEGRIFGAEYKPGSLTDRVVESYAGPHDWLNSHTAYDQETGNIQSGMSRPRKVLNYVLNPVNVVVATPFVVSSVVLPTKVSMEGDSSR